MAYRFHNRSLSRDSPGMLSVCLHVCLSVYMSVLMPVFLSVCECVRVHCLIFCFACMCITLSYTHESIHIYIHTYTYTCTRQIFASLSLPGSTADKLAQVCTNCSTYSWNGCLLYVYTYKPESDESKSCA